MLKHVVKMVQIVNGKEGVFACDNDTPIFVAKEMLCQFMKHLGQIQDNAEQEQKKQEAEQNPNESSEAIEE